MGRTDIIVHISAESEEKDDMGMLHIHAPEWRALTAPKYNSAHP